jgi:ketosteroid isomerase-like protein
MTLRKLLVLLAVAAVALPAAAYSTLRNTSRVDEHKLATLYQIEQIEAKWHKATSKKNLNAMMALWAQNAVWTIGGKTYNGKAEIRQVLTKAGPFQPQNHWISETPAYKIRATVNGNRGSLYFECHYIDVDTKQVVLVAGQTNDVRKIGGKWVIVRSASSSPSLKP